MANFPYSFIDAQCSISGPGGSFNISEGGVENGGITFTMNGDKGTLITGADGTPMHVLHAAKDGKVTLRLLKTSPLNNQLQRMYHFDTLSPANYGQNVISFNLPSRGDTVTAQYCGFVKQPDVTYDKEGAMVEWTFNTGILDVQLGTGSPAAV